MKTMNQVQLIGYIAADPDYRQDAEGRWFLSCRLATDDFTILNGRRTKQCTVWHRITWCAEEVPLLRHYLVEGSHVLVIGQLVYNRFVNRLGALSCLAEIKVSELLDLDR